MNRSYFKWIVLLTIASLAILVFFMLPKVPAKTTAPAITAPPRFSPFKSYISALGIVEARGGNILIGSPVGRIVDNVEVQVGQKVKKGDVLFRLDAHDLEADWSSYCYEYEKAMATVKKLESLPRKEDTDLAEAELKSARIELENAKSQYKRVDGLDHSGAMSSEEVNRRLTALHSAEAKYEQAQASFEKTKAGAWLPDLEIARLQALHAKALMRRVEADIQRTVVQAPTDATVLQVKIHEGEIPDPNRTPPMIIGNIDTLYLRVSINQFDASLFEPDSKAVAYLQGNTKIEFPLKFVHIEPYLVTKQNLSNEITEKVDTRVLQVIYSFEEGENRIYVGEQMNVFIETLE